MAKVTPAKIELSDWNDSLFPYSAKFCIAELMHMRNTLKILVGPLLIIGCKDLCFELQLVLICE